MNIGNIKKIILFTEKNSPPINVQNVQCLVDCGLQGDRFAKGGEKQVTLVSSECLEWILKQEKKGLCFERYNANIIAEGFDTSKLGKEDLIYCNDAVRKVSPCSKECFDECYLRQNNLYCKLSASAKYLKVVKSGEINLNDKIKSKL